MLKQLPITRRLTLLGPAFIAAVAYVDPGNVATNVTAGARSGVPFALVPLVWLTARTSVMSEHVNRCAVTVAASLVAVIIILLNFALLWLTITG